MQRCEKCGQLPSATSESTLVFTCQSCKHFNCASETKTQWIKCSERMPKIGELCFLYQTWPPSTVFSMLACPLPRCFMKIGGLNASGVFILYEDQFSCTGLQYVTHWMPLPEVPHG